TMNMRIAVLGAGLFTIATFGAASLNASPFSIASEGDLEKYLTLDSVELYEISADGYESFVDRQPMPAPTVIPDRYPKKDDPKPDSPKPDTSKPDRKPDAPRIPIPTDGKIDLGTIISIGEKIWAIIEKNKPVVVQNYTAVSAVPQGVKNWDELEGWSEPSVRTYKLVYTNKFKQNVVEFTYRVAYTYGGSYNGKGKYLSRVEIDHSLLNVAWGYKFSAGGEALNITNAGSKENPMAAMEIRLNWAVDTVLKHSDESVR